METIFSETSVPARTTWYRVPEGICYCYHRESIPEDKVLRLYIVPLFGEADEQ
jgi:hypothetical protein